MTYATHQADWQSLSFELLNGCYSFVIETFKFVVMQLRFLVAKAGFDLGGKTHLPRKLPEEWLCEVYNLAC